MSIHTEWVTFGAVYLLARMSREIKSEQLLLAELQVLLAQLRTHLSLVRTGAGLLVSSVTVAFLMLTNYAHLPHGLQLVVIPAQAGLGVLALLGLFIFARSEHKIIKIGRIIREAEHKNKRIDKLMV